MYTFQMIIWFIQTLGCRCCGGKNIDGCCDKCKKLQEGKTILTKVERVWLALGFISPTLSLITLSIVIGASHSAGVVFSSIANSDCSDSITQGTFKYFALKMTGISFVFSILHLALQIGLIGWAAYAIKNYIRDSRKEENNTL